METIRDRYQRVLERIERAARRAGRKAGNVRLVVVTKAQPLEVVQAVIAAGARDLGENYAEEGADKKLALPEQSGLAWHMIGHVQSRKARLIGEHFDYLHSLDSLRLAERLDRFAAEMGRVLPALLECNVSGEETKFGFPAWQEESWPRLLGELGQIVTLPNLRISGLMTMAPFLPEPELARPYFGRLRCLQDFLARHLPQAEWDQLSMGMSADFEVAIEEGATWVRVGTAIVGPRHESEG